MTDRLARAREDVAAGRLRKARDRLEGMLRETPADQSVLEMLGEVRYAMGDLPGAGLAWFLTERRGAEVDIAVTEARSRTGGSPSEFAERLRMGAPLEEFPAGVQERLRSLQREVLATGRRWEPRPVAAGAREARTGLPAVVAWAALIAAVTVLMVQFLD